MPVFLLLISSMRFKFVITVIYIFTRCSASRKLAYPYYEIFGCENNSEKVRDTCTSYFMPPIVPDVRLHFLRNVRLLKYWIIYREIDYNIFTLETDLLILERETIKQVQPTYMVAGFNQWANSGNVSSGIPEYLIEKLNARRVGHIRKGDFYIFQLPGNHFMFRPPVKYVEGYEEDYQEEPINDFHYAEIDGKGLIIFIGTEPNLHEDLYVKTILDAAEELDVKRIIVPAGVGGEVPYYKERHISATYSLKRMQKELKDYALAFSNYDRNATIGMVINHYSKVRGIESIRMTALTPTYQIPITITTDKKAMYDILRRIRYMFDIDLDLSDLERGYKQQNLDIESVLKKLYITNPEMVSQIENYMERIGESFEELKFEELTRIPDVFLKGFDNSI
jgi:proteasome assembly chaperone (PAC2) family protein